MNEFDVTILTNIEVMVFLVFIIMTGTLWAHDNSKTLLKKVFQAGIYVSATTEYS